MKRIARTFIFGLVVLALAGCFRAGQYHWSPDGTRALITNGERWYVVSEPDFTPVYLGDACRMAQWMPDSEQVVMLLNQEYEDWSILEPQLSSSEVQTVKAAAEASTAAVMETPTDATTGISIKEYLPKQQSVAKATSVYLSETASQELKDKLGEYWQDLEEVTAPIAQMALVHLAAGSGVASSTQTLTTFLFDPEDSLITTRLFIAPDGKTAAILQLHPTSSVDDEQPAYRLGLVELTRPSQVRWMNDRIGYYLAWRGDSKQLAYFHYKGEAPTGNLSDIQAKLGSLVTMDIAYNEKGGLANNQPNPVEQVGVLFYTLARMQYAPDGSLFFTGFALQLPATVQDMPQGMTLFRWDPRYPSSIQHALPRGVSLEFEAASGEFGNFVLSPNGGRVALGGEDTIRIYNLGSGEKLDLVNIDTDAAFFEPAWRTNDEICTLVKPGHEAGTPYRSEMVLFDAKTVQPIRCLSLDWPDEVVDDWFDKEDPPEPAPTPVGSESE